MEPAERLAAFLAGDLSADERQAVEADLARDAQLRADLEAARRADGALAAQPPTALPDGARERLLAALEPTLAAELGPDRGATAATDQLAARRRATARRSWITAVGGVAAAVAAVAILGPLVGGLTGGADSAGPASEGAGEAMPESAGDGADEEAASSLAAPVGPTLLGSDRAIDEEGAAELLTAGEVEAVVAQGLSPDEAQMLGDAWAQAFVSDTADADQGALFGAERADDEAVADGGESAEPAAEEDVDATTEQATDGGAADELLSEDAGPPTSAAVPSVVADLQILGDVDPAAREDVARCLGELLDPDTLAVPVLAELVTFQGEPAVAFALVTPDAEDRITRREVWVLSREDCETRYLRQG